METQTNNLLIFPGIVEHPAKMFSHYNSDDSKKSSKSRESGKSFHHWGLPVGICGSVPAFFKAIMRVVAHGLVYFKDPAIIKGVKELMTQLVFL